MRISTVSFRPLLKIEGNARKNEVRYQERVVGGSKPICEIKEQSNSYKG